LSNNSIRELIALRKTLHSVPELAGEEKETSRKIIFFISHFAPDEIIKNIGGEGVAFIFKGKEKGPVILFRCELDALPISEINEFEYKSRYDGKGHKCGHDGHMTVMAGLAERLSSEENLKGTIILLFQPAEESGEGAERVLNAPEFTSIKPDYVFAFHNLPGYKLNSVIVKEDAFASASKGMIVRLTGKTSHAAEPENGINPSIAVAEIIRRFSELPGKINSLKDFTLVTIIHARIGERAFGTSPGYAELMATLRAYRNDDMIILIKEAEKIVGEIARNQKLSYNISYTEEFPATVNNTECVNLIKNAAMKNNYELHEITEPFKWSEDFGHFTAKFKGALFGIGSGEDHPQLHNPDYDFPDEIIPTGINMFYTLIKDINYGK
jgi:amidohydrolase